MKMKYICSKKVKKQQQKKKLTYLGSGWETNTFWKKKNHDADVDLD